MRHLYSCRLQVAVLSAAQWYCSGSVICNVGGGYWWQHTPVLRLQQWPPSNGRLAAHCSGSGITCGTSGIICIGSDVIRAGCSEPSHCDGSIEAAALWRKTRHSRLIEDILAYCGIIYDVNYIPHNFHAPFISRDPRTDTSAPWVDVVTNTCLALQSSYTLNHPILRVDCWPICPKTSPTYPCGIPFSTFGGYYVYHLSARYLYIHVVAFVQVTETSEPRGYFPRHGNGRVEPRMVGYLRISISICSVTIIPVITTCIACINDQTFNFGVISCSQSGGSTCASGSEAGRVMLHCETISATALND